MTKPTPKSKDLPLGYAALIGRQASSKPNAVAGGQPGRAQTDDRKQVNIARISQGKRIPEGKRVG